MGENNVNLHVLLTREGDWWVARCLQYDITGQGESLEDALESLEVCVVGHILTNLRHGRGAFDGIPEAPAPVWEHFSKAKKLAEDRPFRMPSPSEVPEAMRGAIPRTLPRAGASEVRVY